MENASKALIMAASVLVGLMIISIGVALFSSFSEFSKSTIEKVEETKISEWNQNYLKYYGKTTVIEDGKAVTQDILVTAHDIVTVANHARQNNEKYDLLKQEKANENTYYVQVKVNDNTNFEKETVENKNDFLKNNSLKSENKEVKYYTCTGYKISDVTKRVMYIEFKEKVK